MDNYLHPDVVHRQTQGSAALPGNLDFDHAEMAKEVSSVLTAACLAGLVFEPADHEAKLIVGTTKGCCKRIINSYFMRHMTAAEIRRRAAYREDNQDRHEVREWFAAITAHLH